MLRPLLARALAPALASVLTLALAGPTARAAGEPDAKGRVKPGKRGTGFGVGASVGDPMGLSLKWFLRPAHALSAHLAWGLLHHGDGLIEIDYHWHSPPIGDSPIVDAFVYVGGGLGVAFWARPGPGRIQGHDRRNASGGAGLILRAPALGLAYHWTNVPIDTAIELSWAPYLALPDLRHLDASIKVRYFF